MTATCAPGMVVSVEATPFGHPHPATVAISCVTAAAFRHVTSLARALKPAELPAPFRLAARGLSPTRPPCCVTRSGWGREEGGRRLAGWPGLGGASAKRGLARAVGRRLTHQANPPLTTVGGGRGWVAMRRTPRGKPDTPPRSPPLTLVIIIVAAIGRREEPGGTPPSISPALRKDTRGPLLESWGRRIITDGVVGIVEEGWSPAVTAS